VTYEQASNTSFFFRSLYPSLDRAQAHVTKTKDLSFTAVF